MLCLNIYVFNKPHHNISLSQAKIIGIKGQETLLVLKMGHLGWEMVSYSLSNADFISLSSNLQALQTIPGLQSSLMHVAIYPATFTRLLFYVQCPRGFWGIFSAPGSTNNNFVLQLQWCGILAKWSLIKPVICITFLTFANTFPLLHGGGPSNDIFPKRLV